MNLFLAVFIPISSFEFLYLFVIKNNGIAEWMTRASRNSSPIWTYEVITITLLSITKFLTTS
ncbi:hypothetical protein [Prochlorococcus marinus]|uniref:hypothetical protein n=1 Tax=Prochlorococcus marinus TaxID=1219 RepID=UPI0022B5BD2E|nr:hypothetical protein [Prochlorococcus marinus]